MNPLQVKFISFSRDISLASGDVSYTGVGFKPSAIIFLGAIGGAKQACYGMDADSNDNGIMDGTNNTSELKTNIANCIGAYVSSGNGVYGNTKSMDADGFTLTWTKEGSPTGTLSVIALCIA